MAQRDVIACYAADTSGTDGGAEPISIVAMLLQRGPDGAFSRVCDYEGLQEPANLITSEAACIHGLGSADVAGRSFDLGALDRVLDPADAILTWSPRFDERMFARIRLRNVERPWHLMRLAPGYEPSPTTRTPHASRARARVEHMVACLLSPDPAQPGRCWADAVLEQPAVEPPSEYQLEGNAVFDEIIHYNLGHSALGARFTLWTKAEVNFINAYDRSGPNGGPGLIFRLLKSKNRKIAAYMKDGGWVEGEVVEIDGMRRRVHIDFPPAPKPERKPAARRKSPPPA